MSAFDSIDTAVSDNEGREDEDAHQVPPFRADLAAADENPGESFALLLKAIAKFSDVEAKAKDIFKANRLVHLVSEDYKPPPEAVALTMTKSIPDFINAWWREFVQRDLGGTELRQIKWGQLFKVRENRPSLRPFLPADNVLVAEALADPPLNFTWLPQPPRRMDFTEHDAKFLETQTRRTLCATNFLEAAIQALPRSVVEPDAYYKILKSFTPAIKAIMQLQTAQLCQLVQLRRDHWLAKSRNVAADSLRLLRHARTVGTRSLFPSTVMNNVNAQYVQNIQTSAFLNLATSSLQVKQKGNRNEHANRLGSLRPPPDYAREPHLARTGLAIVSPTRRVQRPQIGRASCRERV